MVVANPYLPIMLLEPDQTWELYAFVSCTGAALGTRYIEVYPVVAAAVVGSWLGGVNPPQRRRCNFG